MENFTEYCFKYALRWSQTCTWKILSVPHNTLLGSVPWVGTLTLSWMQLFFSPVQFHPCHSLELLELDHTSSNRHHCFGCSSVAFRSPDLLSYWEQLWSLYVLKEHCLCFTWSIDIDWLIDWWQAITPASTIHYSVLFLSTNAFSPESQKINPFQ